MALICVSARRRIVTLLTVLFVAFTAFNAVSATSRLNVTRAVGVASGRQLLQASDAEYAKMKAWVAGMNGDPVTVVIVSPSVTRT